MKLLRFDTLPYAPPALAEARFSVLAGQARCSTGVTIRNAAPANEAVSWEGKILRGAEAEACA